MSTSNPRWSGAAYWSLAAHWTGRVGSKPHARSIIQCLFSWFSRLYFLPSFSSTAFCLRDARLRGCEAIWECLTVRYLGGAHSKVDWGKLPTRMLVLYIFILAVLLPGLAFGCRCLTLSATCMTWIKVAVSEKGCRGLGPVKRALNAASGFQAPDPSRVLPPW